MQNSTLTSLLFLVVVLGLMQHSLGFAPTNLLHSTSSSYSSSRPEIIPRKSPVNTNVVSCFRKTVSDSKSLRDDTALTMGFFDNISKAFTNTDYKSQDQRVRASHILIKGDDVSESLGKINQIMGELNTSVQKVDASDNAMGNIRVVQPIFSQLAKRESQCSSSLQGGDLGSFGPGKMVREFDAVVFPSGEDGDQLLVPPPVGSLLGPVVTDFGMHMILITERNVNRDQVEEKLARND